jgi:hypothetical protein
MGRWRGRWIQCTHKIPSYTFRQLVRQCAGLWHDVGSGHGKDEAWSDPETRDEVLS